MNSTRTHERRAEGAMMSDTESIRPLELAPVAHREKALVCLG
jgi:hypothetical protein